MVLQMNPFAEGSFAYRAFEAFGESSGKLQEYSRYAAMFKQALNYLGGNALQVAADGPLPIEFKDRTMTIKKEVETPVVSQGAAILPSMTTPLPGQVISRFEKLSFNFPPQVLKAIQVALQTAHFELPVESSSRPSVPVAPKEEVRVLEVKESRIASCARFFRQGGFLRKLAGVTVIALSCLSIVLIPLGVSLFRSWRMHHA